MRKHIIAAALVAVALGSMAASAAEPSESCRNGEVPTSATPLGIGVRQAGDPGQQAVNVYACNDGRFVPAPGVVRVRVDARSPNVIVVADGDSTSALTACSDGYVAVRADRDGAHLYHNADGTWTFTVREKSPFAFAESVAGCAPSPPPPPAP